ncbi:MAG: hypothetical protein ABR579_10365 [Actinomycetota bacterium]
MTATRSDYDLLDDALEGRLVDPSVAELAELGAGLNESLGHEVPPAPGTRALFVQGVSARAQTRRGPRILVPSIALGILALVVAGLSRTALPGSALYQVRKVLASVDLAPSAQHEVDLRITRARDELALAQSLLPGKPTVALDAANIALEQLGQARSFLDDVSSSEVSRDRVTISQLERRAESVIGQATAESSHSPSGGSSPTKSMSGSGAGPTRSDNSGDRGDGSGADNSGRGSDASGSHGSSGDSGSSGSNGDNGSGDGSNHGSSGAHPGSNDRGSGSSSSGDGGSGSDSGSDGSNDHSGGGAQPSPSPGDGSGDSGEGSNDSNGTSDLGTGKGGGDHPGGSGSGSTDGSSGGSLDN